VLADTFSHKGVLRGQKFKFLASVLLRCVWWYSLHSINLLSPFTLQYSGWSAEPPKRHILDSRDQPNYTVSIFIMVNRTHHSHFVALATMLVAFFAVNLASADVEAGVQSEATQPTLEILAEFKDVQSDRDLKWGGSNSRWTNSKAGKGGKGSKPFGASKSSKMQTYPPTTYIPT
jgi:hypothetical protein